MVRHRWQVAIGLALAIHGSVAWRACREKPLPLHAYTRGSPSPASIHMELVETVADGAAIAPSIRYAPKLRLTADDFAPEPEQPRFGLWVLRARPTMSRPHFEPSAVVLASADAGP